MHFRSFPLSSEFSVDFQEVSGNLRRFTQWKNKREQVMVTVVGARSHVLRITDLVLYLHATQALDEITDRRNKIKLKRIK